MNNNIVLTERYKKIQILGQGTFGKVYLCHDKTENRKCCIKTIIWQCPSSDPKITEQHYDMINTEIYILLNLSHSRIIKLWTYFVNFNYVHLVMEYADNGTLYQLIDERNKYLKHFTDHEILLLICDLLLAINYIQIKHVIHRDLKLENILIGNDYRIKIGDFGVAKIYSKSSSICDVYKQGTPLNMAPEVIEFNHYTFLSDVWSLGCIFYELCTFKHPFRNNVTDIHELLLKSKRSEYDGFQCFKLNYDNSLEHLIHSMLIGNPKNRSNIQLLINVPIVKNFYENNRFYY